MWKIVGLLEGRNGTLCALPAELTGSPNEFHEPIAAQRACQAMNDAVGKLDSKLIRYTVLPAIDEGLHEALKGVVQRETVAPPQPLPGWNIKANQAPKV